MKKIVLIEDDEDLCEMVQYLLESNGYQTFLAHDAEKGIRLIQKQKPDLILLDIILPGIDGAEVVKRINTQPYLRDIPIIFLTGLVSDNEREILEEKLNVDGKQYQILGKPFEGSALLKIIFEALGP